MTKHKILATVVAAAATATLSIGASAASRGAVNLGNTFSFSFSGYGGVDYSYGVSKNNTRSYAEFVVSGGNVGEGNYVTLTVNSAKSATSVVSESKKVTVVNGTTSNAINYLDPIPGYGSTNYLSGAGSYYGANVSGTWLP